MASAKKLIVLTGVSRGLGRAMTAGFIDAGHVVAGMARNATNIKELASQYGEPHRFDVVDQADTVQVHQWAQTVSKEMGAPDLLINNASIINDNAPLWQISEDEFSALMDINVKGVFTVCKEFLPAMIERGSGVVVNLSSGWGRSVAADVAPYCASKWAIEGMTQALAQELPPGLAAIPLNPGVINTDMLQSCFGAAASGYEDAAQWGKTAVPYILSLDESHNGMPLSVP